MKIKFGGNNNLISKNNNFKNMIIIFLIITLIIICLVYVNYQSRKKNNNCSYIKSSYDNTSSITNINTQDDNMKYKLCDYYILSASNCCSSGSNKNDFVDICALENCIKMGARFLDFKVYNKKGNPVVAASSSDSNYYKETYNELDLQDVLYTVDDKAFSSEGCPNPEDPLILYFRIFSSELDIYNKIGEYIKKCFDNRLLPSATYANESSGHNIGNKPLTSYMGRVIIIVDKVNKNLFNKSNLKQYTNLTTGPDSPFVRKYYSSDVEFMQDKEDVIKFNMLNLTIVLPDLTTSNENYDTSSAMSQGCQMISLNYQKNDTFTQHYYDKFNSNNCAFILKPDSLRAVIKTIDEIPPVPEEKNCVAKPRTFTVGTEQKTFKL